MRDGTLLPEPMLGIAVFVLDTLARPCALSWRPRRCGSCRPRILRVEVVAFHFQGVVTDNTAVLGVFGPFGTVQINDVFTGRFSCMVGSGNPDQEPSDPELGLYDVQEFVTDQAVVNIAPVGIGVLHFPPMAVLDPLPPDPGTDAFSIAGACTIGADNWGVVLRLTAPCEAVFSDDSLPASLDLGDFDDVRIVRAVRTIALEPGGTSMIDQGELTLLAQVPEPSTLLLALWGLYAGGLLRRHGRNR